jgi:NHLM bacteriocin system ABC transporter ATP-binding protein
METERILLNGGKIHLTLENQYYYQLLSGKIIVYIAALEGGSIGRKHYLAEMDANNNAIEVPSFCAEDEELGKWIFVISALGNAQLVKTIYENEEKKDNIILTFSREINLNLEDKEEFASEVIEAIQRKLVTEELSIYRNRNEHEKLANEGLQSIINVFHKSSSIKDNGKTRNKLYNAVALICKKRGIKIAAYETLVESCGRRFSLNDIARVSHFMLREVKLDKAWYKQDSGYLLVYKETKEADNCVPIACIPSGKNRYKEYNIDENTTTVITEEINEKYVKTAFMIYRPLSNSSINFKDLIKFGIGEMNKTDVIYILFFALLGTLIGLMLPYLNQVIYDEYIPFNNKNSIIQIGFLVVAFSIGNLCFAIVKNLSVYRVSAKMEYSLQSAVFDRLFNLPGNVYETNDSAVLSKSAFSITEIFNLVSEVIITTALAALFSLAYLYRMFHYSISLATLGLILVIFQVTVLFIIGFLQLKLDKEITDINMKESSLIYQLIDGISKIRIAGVEGMALVKYFNLYTAHKKKLYKKDKLSNITNNLNYVLNVGFTGVFYYILIKRNLHLSFGNFMAFISAFGTFSIAILQVALTFTKVNHLIPLFDKCKIILNTDREYKDDLQMVGSLKGNIEVNNVSFSYNEKEDNVISDVSFKIENGEYIGIVGTSGSGKSSLLKLLLGFEKPGNGKIYYDDKDLDCLDKRELRKCFGVVLQEGKLISGSIYENIVLAGTAMNQADKEKETEKVLTVVQEVGLEEDIKNMPMGLQTIISEGAGNISGGQRQKILIARAIYNDPAILFFDEATSALDNMNQALVTSNLEKLKITRIVIAHRLSTVMNCDRIFVMDNGRLVETGRYKELMESKGHFYQLSHRQMA